MLHQHPLNVTWMLEQICCWGGHNGEKMGDMTGEGQGSDKVDQHTPDPYPPSEHTPITWKKPLPKPKLAQGGATCFGEPPKLISGNCSSSVKLV